VSVLLFATLAEPERTGDIGEDRKQHLRRAKPGTYLATWTALLDMLAVETGSGEARSNNPSSELFPVSLDYKTSR
jgi:hypothetical protein